ncbi:hypothetical protein EYZ11_011385 [Aspergillus tanneri]|uniref:HPt domain-containing protein n=1 Tax=Aspergillus tanneri TaxID=1220188 RepID=A0A4S3J541_9EURO|nr:uncharacterized protein ATNIH1004_004685 [Aspergillus tanneri]KAA8648800.1 hypothetical protein ATNIH1004_004685 [Aspergillus tanneri]THC89168.1 hypothetical protein EYZ11_011385 [Aspergillus tanneri]
MAPTTTTKPVEESSSEGPPDLSKMKDSIDKVTFDQILEMDDEDEEREFSRGIVYGFFDQAETTFLKMEKALRDKNLGELSSLGHFLKGSSATLGLIKVKDACEKIQHYGAGLDETGTNEEPDESVSLKNIEKTLTQAKEDYKEVETFLRRFFKS